MKKKFAFLLMGPDYTPSQHTAIFETEAMITRICTARDFDEACLLVQQLQREGFGAVELCGAFGPEKAQTLTQLTNNEMAIGYVTHDPALDRLFAAFFSE